MTTAFHLLIFVFLIHFFADFVLQSRAIANTKSKSWKSLSIHVAIYTEMMLACIAPCYGFKGIYFALINGGAHFVIDACTSRCTSHYYKKEEWHNFFTVIGFDQYLHEITLIFTVFFVLLK